MNKRSLIWLGAVLILLGGMSLVGNLLASVFDVNIWRWGVFRLWPVFVIGLGGFLVAAPLLFRGRKGLGMLFIPGAPILIVGGILLFASVFNAWHVWAWQWPLIIIALALGFLGSALYSGVMGLLVPAIILGANGIIFLFCSITGGWDSWVVLWTIEPLSIGVSLLALNLKHHSRGLSIAGLIMCGVAAFGVVLMAAVLPARGLVGFIGPMLLLGVGGVLLLSSLVGRSSSQLANPEA